MAIDTENGPITSGGGSLLPGEIDPEGGSDGEQLDASLTVFSDKEQKPSERRERQLDAHLPNWRNGKKNGNLLPLMRHDT